MAKLDLDQERNIRAACDSATTEIAAARERALAASAPATLNEAAARAWSGYALTIGRMLSTEQKERLAALFATTRP